MTEKQKTALLELRAKGYTYISIAEQTALPLGTVKAFFNRQKGTVDPHPNQQRCMYCGAVLTPESGYKVKRFCDSTCYLHWWRSTHAQSRKVYTCICAQCEKLFTVLSKKTQKYCSRSCYDTMVSPLPRGKLDTGNETESEGKGLCQPSP